MTQRRDPFPAPKEDTPIMSTQPKPHFTPAQYLAFERTTDRKHEYHDGEMFAMAGASRAHAQIVTNLVATLAAQLRGKDCSVYSSDLRVKVSRTGLYTYPDVVIVCGEQRFDDEHEDTLLNPTAIIEVLSPSTEGYDRGKKFAHYRTLDSLKEYLLIAQDEPCIEQYVRQPDGNWLLHEAGDVTETVALPSVNCTLKPAEVYDKVLPSTG